MGWRKSIEEDEIFEPVDDMSSVMDYGDHTAEAPPMDRSSGSDTTP